MNAESMRGKSEGQEDDDMLPPLPERKATGPFADYPEDEPAPAIDVKTLFEQLNAPRNPDEEVDVASEQERMSENLEHVTKLIEKEKEKGEKLGAVRQDLGVPHEGGETLKNLEEAKEKLKEEQRHIELAGEWNDVLDSFSELSTEEMRHIAETGKTRKGESIRSKYGKEIHSDLAKELAGMHLGGGRRVTWRTLLKLEKVVDQILHDMVSAVKGIFKGPEGGAGRTHSE